MFHDFISSWALFYPSYITGWLVAFSLSLVGVFVVAKDQIFISAAVAQASSFGVALGLWLSLVTGIAWFGSDIALMNSAVLFAVLAALFSSHSIRRDSVEAVTGWIFLSASSGAMLLLTHSPHGTEEVHRLLASSLIGATPFDMWIFVGFAVFTVGMLLRYWQPLLLFTLDPRMAATTGLSVWRWGVFKALWLGLAVGLSIRVSGMLYVFACLVLPALVAKRLCGEIARLLWLTPLIALFASGFGFVFANHYDFPPGQVTVAVLCGLLVLVWLLPLNKD